MSNPEFKRNLWLSFSMHRLIGMPALLALTFLAITLADQQDKVADSLYTASVALFIFIVWLWGARNANATIVDELRDKTWDQQRMSALDPWTMTWGKLFGSTSFNWYGGMMCLVVVAFSGFGADKPDVIPTLLTLCAFGVLLHAALIALNLHTSQFESRIIQRGGMGWLVIIFVFLFMPAFSLSPSQADFLVGYGDQPWPVLARYTSCCSPPAPPSPPGGSSATPCKCARCPGHGLRSPASSRSISPGSCPTATAVSTRCC